jgi:hypothetical protein
MEHTLNKDLCTFIIALDEFLLDTQIFQKEVVGKTETHILCSITFSRKSCRL